MLATMKDSTCVPSLVLIHGNNRRLKDKSGSPYGHENHRIYLTAHKIDASKYERQYIYTKPRSHTWQ